MLKKALSIIIVGMASVLLFAACGTNSNNESQSPLSGSSNVAVNQTQGQEMVLKGVLPPFDLQWGSTIEDCAAKFANDWTEQERVDESEISYILNKKQAIFGKEGVVRLKFVKKPNADTVPENIRALPDYFLESVIIEFESSAEDIKVELEKQYGEAKGENLLDTDNGTLVSTFFSTPDAQVQNMKNENQRKAYHMYRYVVMQDYKDTEEWKNLSAEKIKEQTALYMTNPDELWNQIKDWNFNDGERYINGVELSSNSTHPNYCSVTYLLNDLLYILNIQ